jgi:hypothetical protein
MSQVNFFMLPEDEQTFVEMLRDRGDTRFVHGRFHAKPTPPYTNRIAPTGNSEDCVVLVNPAFGDPPILHSRGSGEHEGEYGFDLYRDPHIEWSRCYLDKGRLVSGRVYSKIGWADVDTRLYKRWYEGIARWIRTSYEPVKGWWVAPGAASWWRTGHLFCFGDPRALCAGPEYAES